MDPFGQMGNLWLPRNNYQIARWVHHYK